MTQMELADKMNISFQAVSNWERGSSMPDIAKLPELAQLFDVTIDDLLGEKSDLIASAAKDSIEDYLENNEVTPEQLSDVAPVLKPDQVDKIFGHTKINNLREVADLLPFLNRDVIDKLAIKAADAEQYNEIDEIIPFVSKDVIAEIAIKMINKGKSIASIAPFISGDMISKVAATSYQKYGLSSLHEIVPFIPRDQLEKIAEEEYAGNGLRNLKTIAPFLSKEFLSKLAGKAIQNDDIEAISQIAPFLDKKILSEYIKENFL